jgi:hypothetical protein
MYVNNATQITEYLPCWISGKSAKEFIGYKENFRYDPMQTRYSYELI